MKAKDILTKALTLYFMLVTFITVLLMILGLMFDSDRTFSYQVFASPLIYAAIGVLPVFLPGKDKELSVKGLIIRRLVEIAVVEVIIIFLAFSADNIPTENKGVVIGIAGGIIVIYLLTNALEYLYEKRESDKLNSILAEYLETEETNKEK